MSTAVSLTSQPVSNSRRALLARKLRQLAQERRHRPLSFAQQRLWFLDQLEPHSPLYNVAALAHVEGELDFDAVEYAINSIIARHEALRTRFTSHDELPEQVVVASLRVKVAFGGSGSDSPGVCRMTRLGELL